MRKIELSLAERDQLQTAMREGYSYSVTIDGVRLSIPCPKLSVELTSAALRLTGDGK